MNISPIIVFDSNKLKQITAIDIMNYISNYSNSRSVLDESNALPVDFKLLNIDEIREIILKQAELGSKGGLKLVNTDDEVDDFEELSLEFDDELENQNNDTQNNSSNNTTDSNDLKKIIINKFKTYYVRILFYSFLSDSKLSSLKNIISTYEDSNNQRILRPYSKSMQKLLSSGKYNAGARPSEHKISEKSFLKENKGSISHNVLELSSINGDDLRLPYSMLSIANTKSNDFYTRTCKKRGFTPHPARMPLELASFFIDFLTDEGDIVFDPFGGSNTTGFCAEKANRKWISIEANEDYGKQSMIRFEDPSIKTKIKTNME